MAGRATRVAIARNPKLIPADDTIEAFVAWIQELGLHGDWLQAELYVQYADTCAIADRPRIPLRDFKTSLRKAGVTCWRDDTQLEGRRHRPEMATIEPTGRLKDS